jgi:hypothetical protein
MRRHPMTAIVAVSALAAASCAHRSDTDPDASSVHDSDIDTRPSSDANLMGILLDHAETPRTIDEGFHLGTTVPILTMHFWERDEGCDELRGPFRGSSIRARSGSMPTLPRSRSTQYRSVACARSQEGSSSSRSTRAWSPSPSMRSSKTEHRYEEG